MIAIQLSITTQLIYHPVKTFMGVEFIRVLIENNVGPILLIAFTNHALDHMLHTIVEKERITTDVVRLGGRSADESIKRFSIEELERTAGRSRLNQAMNSEFRAIKLVEEEIMRLLKQVIGIHVPARVLLNHVSIPYPDHVAHLEDPPSWIAELHTLQTSTDEADSDWKEAGKKRPSLDTSLYAFWKTARDLSFLRDAQSLKSQQVSARVESNRYGILDAGDSNNSSSSGDDNESTVSGRDASQRESNDDYVIDQLQNVSNPSVVDAFFLSHGFPEIPSEPDTERTTEELLEGEDYDVWSYSADERARLDAHWVSQYRESTYDAQRRRFEDLVERHAELRQRQRNRDEEVLQLLFRLSSFFDVLYRFALTSCVIGSSSGVRQQVRFFTTTKLLGLILEF